jgi:hypothetical protein
VQSTDNADSLQPCEYTTDTIDTLCDKRQDWFFDVDSRRHD